MYDQLHRFDLDFGVLMRTSRHAAKDASFHEACTTYMDETDGVTTDDLVRWLNTRLPVPTSRTRPRTHHGFRHVRRTERYRGRADLHEVRATAKLRKLKLQRDGDSMWIKMERDVDDPPELRGRPPSPIGFWDTDFEDVVMPLTIDK